MAKAKKDEKNNVSILITENNFADRIEEYNVINSQKLALENQAEILKQSLKAYTQRKGTKTDTGTLLIELPNLLVEERAKKSVKPSLQKVITHFAVRPEIVSQLVKVTTALDETALERLLDEGVITADDIEKVCDISTSYSFYVTPKEEMPEVQKGKVTSTATSQLAAAQRKKPLLKPKLQAKN